MTKVFLSAPHRDRLYVSYFSRICNFSVTSNPERISECGLAVLTGGEDVNPELYHEYYHPRTGFDIARDEEDERLFDLAVLNRVPIVGICRGAQFLHVQMGGRLFQHVTKHKQSHNVEYDGRTYYVTSTHHQMMRSEVENSEVLVTADKRSMQEYVTPEGGISFARPREPELEVIRYTDYPALAFQPHPEYAAAVNSGAPTHNLFVKLLKETFDIDAPTLDEPEKEN